MLPSEPSLTPTVVLGAGGYVAGELMRLLALQPRLRLASTVSRSGADRPMPEVFPHLRGVWDDVRFTDREATDAVLDVPKRAPAVYGAPHAAPERYGAFFCGLSELTLGAPAAAVAHPSCFTTAVTLACAPAQALGLARPRFRVAAVTGSTGSGRTPSATTHHPDRHGNLKAYRPLAHRHGPEMEMLIGRVGGDPPGVSFVPHSGPFARGIHATVHLDLVAAMTTGELAEAYAPFYEETPFVSAGSEPPPVKDVVGSNRCRIGLAADGTTGVVLSVIDNLTKGAAGVAVQWMNRLWGWDETLGLRLPAVGWS